MVCAVSNGLIFWAESLALVPALCLPHREKSTGKAPGSLRGRVTFFCMTGPQTGGPFRRRKCCTEQNSGGGRGRQLCSNGIYREKRIGIVMTVTTLDEKIIQDIGHAFSCYDHGEEHGLIDAFPVCEAVVAFIGGYVRMTLQSGMLYSVGKRRGLYRLPAVRAKGRAEGGPSAGQGVSRRDGSESADPLCPDHVEGRLRAG